MDSLARIAAEPVMAVAVVDHGISFQEGNPTTLMDLFKVIPKGCRSDMRDMRNGIRIAAAR
jgi:hypothetical protein